MENNMLILGVSLIIVVLLLMYSRARMILQTWAGENDCKILSSKLRFLNRGPYTWTLFGKQWVFHVAVRDTEGTIRTGYVKCGSFFWGVFVNKAEAIWDG